MKRVVLTVLVVAALVVVVIYWADIAKWFLHGTGSDDTSDTEYGFFSGSGSDITELTVVAGLVAIYKKHTCHEPRCWRIGHHPVEGTPFQACRKHHPGMPDTATKGHMTAAWREARNR